MRLVSYKADGGLRAGLVTGEKLVDLERAGAEFGVALSSDLLDVLAMEVRGLEVLRQIEAGGQAGTVESTALDESLLGPAVPRPGKLLCLAGNYQSHLTEGGGQGVNKAEVTPRFFIKPTTAIIGTGDSIKIPPVSETVDYEIEIAAVIGKRGRDIALADADGYIGGYLVFNDISARHLKGIEHRKTRPMDDFFDWLVGKWCDSFAVVGPYLVTRDEVPDPTGLEMALRVNGTLKQHSSAGEMIFTVPEAIAWISGFITLEPGDLICMGTPGGVGETTQTYLQPGDVVEGEIEQLGKIVNPVA
jgi:2-keto-4-pentenoate hydratase/2-oxohepta-3-ene-1,7-dioic acid hydratase in catechol pathway